jgi:hypothetical protein
LADSAEWLRVHAAWREAESDLRQAEARARQASEPQGYAYGRRFLREHWLPALDALVAVAEEYEALRAAVYRRTGAKLPGLGRMELSARGVADWEQNLRTWNPSLFRNGR